MNESNHQKLINRVCAKEWCVYPFHHSWSFSRRYANEKGDAWVEDNIQCQRGIAMTLAKEYGIKDPIVNEMFDLDVMNAFTEYPMYLCGPKAPQIKTWKDVFKYVWHIDNPVCKHTVIVRDKEIDKMLDNDWMTEKVATVRSFMVKGMSEHEALEAFQRTGNWAPNVMKQVKRSLSK